jgi:hypothetical protein
MTNMPAVLAILASAVIVLTGVVALTRAVWRVASDLRENKTAVAANTRAIERLVLQMDGRFTSIKRRLSHLEGRRPSP